MLLGWGRGGLITSLHPSVLLLQELSRAIRSTEVVNRSIEYEEVGLVVHGVAVSQSFKLCWFAQKEDGTLYLYLE